MIETMLDVRRAIFEGYAGLHRVVLQAVQHDPICRRVMTVPGVGSVAARLAIAEERKEILMCEKSQNIVAQGWLCTSDEDGKIKRVPPLPDLWS
jgi:hypothetical protein